MSTLSTTSPLPTVPPCEATQRLRLLTPTKPDLRTGLVMIVMLAVATGRMQSGLGSIALTATVFVLAVLLGLGPRVWPSAVFYLVLRLIYAGSVAGATLPVLPYLGITVSLILSSFPVYLAVWIVFVKLPMGEVMASLERARTPRSLLIVFMVVYRYVPTLLGEMRTIAVANGMRQQSPAWKRWALHPLKQIENIMVPLMMRSGKIADELSAVAICKGLDSSDPRSALVTPRIQTADVVMVLGVAAAIALILVLDAPLQTRWF